MRAMIKYSRKGAARFISHLDMQRAFARALRRAGLPVKYSEGFNPHIVMSFASPLSVGVATRGDYLEVRFDDECSVDAVADGLNTVLPEDIRIVFAGRIADDAPKLMAANHSAEYELVFERDMEDEARAFMETESFVTTDRKGRQADIRPLVYALETRGNILTARLANSSSAALNPAVLVKALTGEAAITRLDCFCVADGKVMPFETLGTDI